MDNTEQIKLIQDLTDQVNKLKSQIDDLSANFYKNNFSSRQDFNKASSFNSSLKVPVYSSVPATCEIGQVGSYNGDLIVCETTNNWVIVGTQS